MSGGRALVVAFLLVAGSTADAEGELFVRSKIEFPGKIEDHLLADVDGDGRLDVLVVHAAAGDRYDYRLAVCRQQVEKKFDGCEILDLPDDVRAFDVGNVDPAPGAEFVAVTASGVFWSAFEKERLGSRHRLAEVPSVFAGTDPDIPRPLDVLFDLDGDGRDELLLPSQAGPVWVKPDGKRQLFESPAVVLYRLANRSADVNAALRSGFQSRVTSEMNTPDVHVFDWNGDGRLDVVTQLDNILRIFLQDETGGLPGQPSRTLERSTLAENELDSSFTGEVTSFAQLDLDGQADLILTKWGSSEERTRMDRAIFFSRPDGSYPDVPDQLVRSESVTPDFDLVDLDGNGTRDLVVPFFHFAPSQAVKVITQNALRWQLRIFLLGADGRYSQDEGKKFARIDHRVVLDYKLDILKLLFGKQARPTGRIAPLLDFGADFDGDGYADLAADDGGDKLRIYWGNAEARYSSSPDQVVPFESTLAYDLVDADGDGLTDLFAYHGTRPVTEQIGGHGFHAVKRRRTERERARRAEEARRARKQEEEVPHERVRLEILMSVGRAR
ncbi:MAG: VCBS repeat-containing protein [Deltaproteobacteria bacterium]|nr:VCBS repeat-containing protein [Deltaproteobacteria bacterium]